MIELISSPRPVGEVAGEGLPGEGPLWSPRAILFVVWIGLSLSCNFVWFEVSPHTAAIQNLHDGIIAHTAAAPFAYRILVPLAVQGFAAGLNAILHNWHTSLLYTYALYVVLAFTFSAGALFALYRSLFNERDALLGMVITGASMFVAFYEWQPWSMLEPGLYALAMLFILRERHLAFGALLVVASFNRETAVYLVVLICCAQLPRMRSVRQWRWPAGYFILWMTCYGAIRLFIGPREQTESLSSHLKFNLQIVSLLYFALKAFIFFGPLWALVRRGWRIAPDPIKYGVLAFPLFALTTAPLTVWAETRLWTPYYCVLAPLILYGLKLGFKAGV
jgi:hypothetical protein